MGQTACQPGSRSCQRILWCGDGQSRCRSGTGAHSRGPKLLSRKRIGCHTVVCGYRSDDRSGSRLFARNRHDLDHSACPAGASGLLVYKTPVGVGCSRRNDWGGERSAENQWDADRIATRERVCERRCAFGVGDRRTCRGLYTRYVSGCSAERISLPRTPQTANCVLCGPRDCIRDCGQHRFRNSCREFGGDCRDGGRCCLDTELQGGSLGGSKSYNFELVCHRSGLCRCWIRVGGVVRVTSFQRYR
jgi:hypothetical protein